MARFNRRLVHEVSTCTTNVYNSTMRLRKHIVLRIDEKSLAAVQRIAKKEDESVARIIRRAIVAFVDQHKKRQ